MEKRDDRNVAGRKAMVKTAIVFMEELSRRAASARSLPALATAMLTFESSCVRKAKSWTRSENQFPLRH